MKQSTLKDLYTYLKLFEYLRDNYPCAKPEKLKQDIIDLKHEIRNKLHEDDNKDYRMVYSTDSKICYLHEFPEDITTEEEANEYFEDYLRCYCTDHWGNTLEYFTGKRKIFQRNGKFFCYHELWINY